MKIENMQARIRPRTCWEAMDLGTRMFQQWWFPAIRIWLAFTLVPLIALCMLIEKPFIAAFVFWWLKPLWERPLLAFYSEALFAEPFSLKKLFSAFLHYALPGLLSQLTLGRFNLSRSFHTPVAQLEKTTGLQKQQRINLLARAHTRSTTMTVLVYHLEQALCFGFYTLVFVALPLQLNIQASEWFIAQESLPQWILISCWYLAMSITEPLYVASGFALYLNRRTWLEAWDLELDFRKAAQQRQKTLSSLRNAISGLAVLFPACIMLFSLLLPAAPAQAETPSPTPAPTTAPKVAPTPDKQHQRQAIQLLASETFMPFEHQTDWDFSNPFSDSESNRNWLLEILKKLFSNNQDEKDASISYEYMATAAKILEFIFWVFALSCLAWLLLKAGRWLHQNVQSPSSHTTHPVSSVAGLNIHRNSLPSRPFEQAAKLLEEGRLRECLSLLYRYTLSALAYQHQLPFERFHTEQECIAITSRQLGADHVRTRLLKQVTRLWVLDAWGHKLPEPDQIRALLENTAQSLAPATADHKGQP